MTKQADKSKNQSKPKKLKVNKETIKDLKSGDQAAEKVKGGRGPFSGSGRPCSDRNLKENFAPIDEKHILAYLMALPIQKWNYKSDDPSVRHIGPMAQDFAAAFGVGEDDRHIHVLDIGGVAFAAIQALYQLIREQDAEINSLRAELNQMQERMTLAVTA